MISVRLLRYKYLFFFAAWLVVLAAGLMSDLSLGDEPHHFRIAKLTYETGTRIAYEPAYESGNPPGYFIYASPLWHFLLVGFWKVLGSVSVASAQIYHSLFYLLFLFLLYRVGKDIVGERSALYAVILAGTMPMVVAFSIMLYIDMPAIIFSLLSFWMILKRKVLFAALAFALAYYTKQTTIFLLPGFVVLFLVMDQGTIKKRCWKSVLFLLVVIGLTLPDIYWRATNAFVPDSFLKIVAALLDLVKDLPRVQEIFDKIMDHRSEIEPFFRPKSVQLEGYSAYLPSYIFKPSDLIKYFGIGLPIAFLIGFRRIRFQREDLYIVLPVLGFSSMILLVPTMQDIRYLMPTIPFLCLGASRHLNITKKPIIILFALLCLIQFSASTGFVVKERSINPQMQEALNYLKEETPEDSFIMYPEYLILQATGRRAVWGVLTNLSDFLWFADIEELGRLFEQSYFNYIMISDYRIYDDSEVRHYGGFPISFVKKIPEMDFLEEVFSNPKVTIYRIKR